MLGDTEVPRRAEAQLSGLGVQSGASLLVHQWNDVKGTGAGKLAEKDEDMQTMQGVSGHDATVIRNSTNPKLSDAEIRAAVASIMENSR